MLNAWGPKTSVGNAEDQLQAILPIKGRLVEGEYTDQCETGRRGPHRSLYEHFTVIPPINVRSVEANAHCMGAKKICWKRWSPLLIGTYFSVRWQRPNPTSCCPSTSRDRFPPKRRPRFGRICLEPPPDRNVFLA